MALLKIARMGHPVLRSPAKPVADPRDPAIRRLVEDMIETMRDAPGIGLAAPQVHVPLRVVVYFVPAERAQAAAEEGSAGEEGSVEAGEAEGRLGDAGADGDGAQPLSVLINPVIEPLGPETADGWEGCLSVPGMMGLVPRFTAVRVRALGLEGEPIERIARGFHARVVQHECDHLDGMLYPMRITDLTRFGFVEEIRRAQAPAEDEL